MSEIEEIPVIRVDYRKLAKQCAYCKADPDVIRVTHLLDGQLMISAMCMKHAHGEQLACLDDMVNVPGTGTFLSKDLNDPESRMSLLIQEKKFEGIEDV